MGAQRDDVLEGDAGGHDLAVGLDGDAVDDVGGEGPHALGHQAALAEGRVEGAVGVVAGQGEVLAAADVAHAGHHDLPVGLERQRVGPVVGVAEVGEDHAVVAERRVEVLRRRVAGQSGDAEVSATVSCFDVGR